MKHSNPKEKMVFSLLLPLPLLLFSAAAAATTTLIFKGCSSQKFPNPTAPYTTSLQTLLSSLSSLSSSSSYSNSTSGDISGLFQCRGDLSPSDCSLCVSEFPKLTSKLCPNAVAARIHLTGCYLRYELSGFGPIPATQFLYKICGSGRGGVSGLVGPALGEVVKGVEGSGFYAGEYMNVYVLGQCEGSLGNSDCVGCVKSAVERVESECGNDSVSGQVYLQGCYISYRYYSSGVPVDSDSGGGRGKNTQKTVAIVVGGVVGFGLVIAALLFLKSAFKKRDTNKY